MIFFYKEYYLGILYIFLFFNYINPIDAQVVYELNSQSEVDLFAQDITTINGDIIINGDDIDNLFSLSLIQHITGSLIIGDTLQSELGNDILTHLAGLNNLKTIGKDLRIIGNPALTSLHGLHNLETINNNIIWKNLPLLSTANDLQLLTNSLNGNLHIENTALSNLTALHSLHSISGTLSFFSNQNLTQIDLPNLTQINGGLHLVNNSLIPDFAALESLEFLGADLVLIVNNSLTSLDGLEALSIIDGDLAITANGVLNNLNGLSNVEVVTDSLIVNYNSNLASCCGIFPSLLHEDTGLIIIQSNAENCGDETEIIDYCSTIDTDEDGIADIDDNCPMIHNTEQIDMDEDGFGELCDCDDNQASVNMNAVEIFNNDIDDDCDGEVDEGSPTVTDCSPFSASILSQTNVSCAGGNDGAISLHFEGATMPVSWNWTENLGDLQSIDNLAAGTFAATLTDANGCMTSVSTLISEPAPLSVQTSSTPANCEGIDGQIDLTVSGGTSPYAYFWAQEMGNTEDLQGLEADTYHVTISDANACQIVVSETVAEQDCPDLIYFQFTKLQLELRESNEVEIQFSTLGEIGNGTFFLEHSLDGLDFHTIENQVVGNGFNAFENQYSMQHSSPDFGYNYYRIMYLSFDNTIYHSQVEEVFLMQEGKNIVFPNPSSHLVNIQLAKEKEEYVRVEIYNDTGLEMMNREFSDVTDLISLDISSFPVGIYFIRVNSEKSLLMTDKIIKGIGNK